MSSTGTGSGNGDPDEPTLQRTIGFPLLVLYGMGTMVGAGFYALSGKVAGQAGLHAPVAFGLAGLLAMFSALAFAELSSRLPHAGGSARYLEEAFARRWLSALTGWLIITTGIVSAATLSVATVNFLGDFVSVPERPALVVLVLILGGIAAWGVREAVGLVVAISVVQIVALLYVAIAASGVPDAPSRDWTALLPPLEGPVLFGVLSAAFLAFYAFIGFEDMVNMAEEVRDVRRTMPKALVLSLILTAALYMLVSTALVMAIPPTTLAEANTPLAEAVRHHGRLAVDAIGVVSILSAVNSALVQIVMVARVAYGMANRGYAPQRLSSVGRRTQTPWLATALATGVIAALSVTLEMTTLANITSGVLLMVFASVNIGLWWIKGFDPKDLPTGSFSLPRIVPLVGAAVSISALVFMLVQSV